MHFTKMMELKKIVNANLEFTERMTMPTSEGVRLIAEFLGAKSYDEYFGVHGADIILAIDVKAGTRPGVNQKAAKEFFGGSK